VSTQELRFHMKKKLVRVILDTEVFYEDNEDLVETIHNSFEIPIPHLINPKIVDILIDDWKKEDLFEALSCLENTVNGGSVNRE